MNIIKHHICVCICTFKRPALLAKLLNELAQQRTEGLFTYSIVVADNDFMKSGQTVVADFADSSAAVPIKYCVEPEQNIAMARNKALENADGDFIAFIDDDEYPSNGWLLNMFKACNKFKVDGVLGPVKSYFEHNPPQWIIKGNFFERPEHADGYELDWPKTRTGNFLFRRDILGGDAKPFNSEFGSSGEDTEFFRVMIGKGYRFAWCNEAIVYEFVPPSRCSRSYLMRRAMLQGGNFPKIRKNPVYNLVKSIIAIPVYALALPVLALFGQHMFIKYLIKLCHHTSRIMSCLGFQLVRGIQT
jgi:succinoglycan biosynthesis protein ExoM